MTKILHIPTGEYLELTVNNSIYHLQRRYTLEIEESYIFSMIRHIDSSLSKEEILDLKIKCAFTYLTDFPNTLKEEYEIVYD